MIGKEGAKIGRHTDNLVQIVDDTISRFHASIEHKFNKFYIKDLGSISGTYIKISDNFMLQEG